METRIIVICIKVLFLGVSLLKNEVTIGSPFQLIKTKFVSLCVGFNIATYGVCSGVFDVFGVEVLPVLNVTQIGKLTLVIPVYDVSY